MQTLSTHTPPGRVIALLGAESTGKTTLARALRDSLAEDGRSVALVEEYLREFCVRQGRTPRLVEQRSIASEQTRRIERAIANHQFVIADTTALQVAVYSDFVFDDTTLTAESLAAHATVALTLLTALDLPWQPDGHQRAGEHVRAPVDALLRGALNRAQLPFSVIHGSGPARLNAALASARSAFRLEPSPSAQVQAHTRWRKVCERCGDPDCERHGLAG